MGRGRPQLPLENLSEHMSSHPQINAKRKADPNLLPFRFALKAYIKEEKLRIPVLPDVAARVMQLVEKPSVSANELARLIHKDQAMAGHVLRVSNSPIYAAAKEIVTLRQAVARIGARALGRIVLSISMQGTVFNADGYQDDISEIWKESLASGALSQEIGKKINYSSESLYLCGLLHSVGKPVILQALDDLKREFKLPLSLEGGRTLMYEFHQDVGGRVAQQWKLPEPVRKTALHYLNPDRSDTYKKEVYVTYLANRLSAFVDREPEEGELVGLADDPHVQWLNIKESDLEDLGGKLERIKALLEVLKL